MQKLYTFLFVSLLLCSTNIYAQVTGPTTVCEDDEVAYTVPTVGGASYLWSITGGTIGGAANLDNATITWGAAGIGTIVVTVNPPSGPTIFHTLNVTINPKPTPVITHAPYAGCPPDTIRQGGGPTGQPREDIICEKVCDGATITYTTDLNAGSTYSWVATGATTVTGATTNTVTVTWDDSDLGELVVYETNSFGCMDSATLCIIKIDPPVAFFTSQSSACRYTNVPFTNGSTDADSYSWDFGDGGTSTVEHPNYAYSSPGTYTITLIAMNECFCADTFQRMITIDSLPGPEISCPSTICAGDTVDYSATGDTACTFNWFAIGGTITGGQGTPDVTVAWGAGQIGTLGLYLTGCTTVCDDTTLIHVPIVPVTGTISGEPIVCPGACETYSLPHFSGAIYNWSLSSGCGELQDSTNCEEVTICWSEFLFSCEDTLMVEFYDSFLGCGGTAEFIIKLRPELQIFGSSEVCANTVSTFGSAISCNWSISPAGPTLTGSPGSSVNINWNNLPGTYVVTAVPVDTSTTCSDSATYVVIVTAPPPAPVIVGDTLVCPNSTHSYCAPGSGSNVNWIITNGSPASGTGNCLTVNWGASGPFIVQAYEQLGEAPFCNSDTTTLNVQQFVSVNPIINGPTTACANGSSTFSTPTIYPAGADYVWSITPANAGAVLSQGSPSTVIEWGNNAPLTVSVTLTVNVCGTAHAHTVSISLNPVPVPVVTQLTPLCDGGSAQLQATGGVSYSWSGPSAFTSTANPVTITADGLYQVTVTDANGCTALSQITVFPVSGPNASISSDDFLNQCIGTPFSVDMCALGNPNYTYLWSTGATTQCITTTSTGTFTCTVTDITNNCVAISNSLTVTESSCTGTGGPGSSGCQSAGTISFTHAGCNPVSFTNTSVGGSGWNWNFGDGNTSTSTSPTHTYTEAGFYLVVLTGTFPDIITGAPCTLIDTAQIEIPLAANYDFVSGCDGDPVCFTDMSSYTAGNNITTWYWDFGDGNTSGLQNPCHTYVAAGTYTVQLIIDNGTCNTDYIQTVTVLPNPVAAYTAPDTSCVNIPILFTDASTGSVNYWSWDFGDGGTSLNQNPVHGYAVAGTYTVTLAVADINGCVDTVSNSITIVNPAGGGPITASPDTVVCEGTTVTLTAPLCAGCTYSWSTGSTADTISVTTTGIYAVTVTDGSGCPYSTFIRIIVNTAPPAIIINSGEDEICLGESISLNASFNANWTYEWFTNDVVNDGSTSFSIFYMPAVSGVYSYQLAVTDVTTGCADTSLPYLITVHDNPAPPTITVVGTGVVCEGETITMIGSHPDPTATLQWSTGEITDTIVITDGGCYQLQATDTNGCTSAADYCATVHPLPELCSFYEGCLDTCPPFVIKGPIGGTSYQWLFNGSPIGGATMQNYNASLSGLYSVEVTNSYGCTDTTGYLDLNLEDCPDTADCASMVVDSVVCDEHGNYVMWYRVTNHSLLDVSQVNLEVLQPNLGTLYAPNVVFTTVPAGSTSGPLSTTIYSGNAGDSLCFRSHITAYDSLGHEVLCCYSDTVCVELPPCDTTCCRFELLSDSIWCEQTSIGTKYYFDLEIDGCGSLFITTGNSGVLNITSPYTLINGINTVSGSYIANANDDTLCLVFMVMDQNQVFCADTSICFPLECHEHPLPCDWSFKPEVCVDHSAIFNYYGSTAGITFNWSFPGGVPSSATGPGPHSILYPTVGVYPVTLTMTNSAGTTTCTDSITVLAAPVATISQTGNTLNAGPAGMSYQWYNGTPWTLLFGENNQYYHPDSSGYFCVVVTDRSGCSDTVCTENQHVGIDDYGLEDWNLYPNPNQGNFTLSMDAVIYGEVSFTVMNVLGETVDQRVFDIQPGTQQFHIRNDRFATGIYFIQLQTESGTSVKRMVVE